MAPRIFVHVGSPKTGTTFLQQVLWAERDKAAAQGVHLPLTSMHDHFLGSLDVRGLGGKPPHPADSAGAWSRLVDAAVAVDGTALISHELFAAATPAQAKNAMGWFGVAPEMHVVITARDLVRQVTAEWQEHVKHRSSLTLEEFVARVRTSAEQRSSWFWRVQDCARLASSWGSRLPASRVHVVTVPPPGAGGELLWERFAGLLGLRPETFDLDAARSNTSLGREQTEVLRRVNTALGERLPIPGPYPGVAKDVLAHGILAQHHGAPLRLDPGDAEMLVTESHAVVARLAESGVDVVGSLDDLVPSDQLVAQATDPDAYAAPDTEALLAESVQALADVLVTLSEVMEQRRELERQAERLRTAPVRAVLGTVGEGRPALDKVRGLYRRTRGD